MLANVTSSNSTLSTVPGAEHLLDFRAPVEEQFLQDTPLQDMALNADEKKPKAWSDFKLSDDPLPADFYKSF